MVNSGHASKGCKTCKIRRIKCDEARPVCRKCTTSKRICLGYDKPLCAAAQTTGSSTVLLSRSDLQTRAADAIGSNDVSCPDDSVNSELFQQSKSSMQAVHSTIEACFQSLQNDVAQTIEQRRNLHKKYQAALQSLRCTILTTSSSPSTDPSMAAYCFALYEVSQDTEIRHCIQNTSQVIKLVVKTNSLFS
jgi:hypothetical protein